jgi:hypothetical protein
MCCNIYLPAIQLRQHQTGDNLYAKSLIQISIHNNVILKITTMQKKLMGVTVMAKACCRVAR